MTTKDNCDIIETGDFMVIKTKKGYFEVIKNVKDALDITKFEECYIEEWYDQFNYIVGDISDSKLRLKGFSNNQTSKVYYHYIPDYLLEECNYHPTYFILKKVTQEYYDEHKSDKLNESITSGENEIFHLEKENFDKESLTLTHTKKSQPQIVINTMKMNQVRTYALPDDLAKEVLRDKLAEAQARRMTKDRQNRPRHGRSR